MRRVSPAFLVGGVVLILLGGLGGALTLSGDEIVEVDRKRVWFASRDIGIGEPLVGGEEGNVAATVVSEYLLPVLEDLDATAGMVALQPIAASTVIHEGMLGTSSEADAAADEIRVALPIGNLSSTVLVGSSIVLVEATPESYQERKEQCERYINDQTPKSGDDTAAVEVSVHDCEALSDLWTFPNVVQRGEPTLVPRCRDDGADDAMITLRSDIAELSWAVAQQAFSDAAVARGFMVPWTEAGSTGRYTADGVVDGSDVFALDAQGVAGRVDIAVGLLDAAAEDAAAARTESCEEQVTVVWPPGENATMTVRLLARTEAGVEVGVPSELAPVLAKAAATGRIAYHYPAGSGL